jgi:hypothetical protein
LASVVPLGIDDCVGVIDGVKLGVTLIVGVIDGVNVKVGVILGVKLIVGVGVLVGVKLIVGVGLGVKLIVGVIEGVGCGDVSGALYTFNTAAHTCLGCFDPFGYIISLMLGCLLYGFGGIL